MPHTARHFDADHAVVRALSAFRYEIRKFLHFSETAAREEGLEPQQHQLMLAILGIEEPAGPTIRMLADYLLIQHHSAVGLIDRLAERGCVERIRDTEDRREVRIRLTAEGVRKLQRLAGIHREELRQSAPALVAALQAVLH